MANLTDASSFDPVYQLEVTDRVKGGAGGIANSQAQSLANRTLYLKNALEALDGSGGPFDYDASGGAVPAPGTGSGLAGAIKRKDQFVVSVAGTVSGVPLQVGDSLLAKKDLPTLITDYVIVQGNSVLATPTVLGLIKLVQNISGGAAADTTLSVTGLINIFAQLASPTFTGNPLAPTQAPGNNTTRLANTAFVMAAIAVEITARAAADTTLQNNINAEQASRISSDNSESVTRNVADNTLQSNIDAANTARANADITLQNNINAEITARAAAISAEAAARAANDTAIINSIPIIRMLGGTLTKNVGNGAGSEVKVLNAELPNRKLGFWCTVNIDATNAGDVGVLTYLLVGLSAGNIISQSDPGYAGNANGGRFSWFCPMPPGQDATFRIGHFIGSTAFATIEILSYM
jgi:hypothetical protein